MKAFLRSGRLQRGTRRRGGGKALRGADGAIRRNQIHLNGGSVGPAVEIGFESHLNRGIGGAPYPTHLDGLAGKRRKEIQIRCTIEILCYGLRVHGKPTTESGSAVADVSQ